MPRPPLPTVGADSNGAWGTKNNAVLADLQSSADAADAATTTINAAIGVNRMAALQPFHVALAKRAVSPVDVVVIGDSITEGWNATTREKRWVALLRDKLRTSFPVAGVVGGEGYIPTAYRATPPMGQAFVPTGGALWASETYGLGRRARTMSVAGNKLTITVTCSSFDVLYVRWPGSTVVSVIIDGGAPQNIAMNGVLQSGTRWNSGALAPGSHSIELAWVSGGVAYMEGMMAFNGDETKGIRMWEGGKGGVKSDHYVSAPGYWQTTLTTIEPDLVIVELGTNDWMYNNGVVSTFYGNFPPSWTKTNLEALISVIRAKTVNDPSIVLLAVHPRGDNPPVGTSFLNAWSEYVDAMYAIAVADAGVTVLDLPARIGPTPWLTSGLLDADKIHPVDAGQEFFASAIAGFLETR